MKFTTLKTEKDYQDAIRELEGIGDSEGFSESDELLADFEKLSESIYLYEQKNFPIEKGNPLDIIKLKMSYMGLERKDLTSIASSGVLSEVFNKKRGLSKKMIRQFAELLNIDQSVLNTPYILTPSVKSRSDQPSISRPIFEYIKEKRITVDTFTARVRNQCMLFNISPVCSR